MHVCLASCLINTRHSTAFLSFPVGGSWALRWFRTGTKRPLCPEPSGIEKRERKPEKAGRIFINNPERGGNISSLEKHRRGRHRRRHKSPARFSEPIVFYKRRWISRINTLGGTRKYRWETIRYASRPRARDMLIDALWRGRSIISAWPVQERGLNPLAVLPTDYTVIQLENMGNLGLCTSPYK